MVKKITATVLGLAFLCVGAFVMCSSECIQVVDSNFVFVKCSNCGATTAPGGPCHACKK